MEPEKTRVEQNGLTIFFGYIFLIMNLRTGFPSKKGWLGGHFLECASNSPTVEN